METPEDIIKELEQENLALSRRLENALLYIQTLLKRIDLNRPHNERAGDEK